MYACRYLVRKARPTTAAASSSQRVRPVWSDRTTAHADTTSRNVSSASGLLNRNIRTATGVRAITAAAATAATAPADRRTASATSATLATPSSASGSSMLHELNPRIRPDSAISHSDAGGLSTVMKPPASNAPKKNALQPSVPAATAAGWKGVVGGWGEGGGGGEGARGGRWGAGRPPRPRTPNVKRRLAAVLAIAVSRRAIALAAAAGTAGRRVRKSSAYAAVHPAPIVAK